jgi:hypothetical protein
MNPTQLADEAARLADRANALALHIQGMAVNAGIPAAAQPE